MGALLVYASEGGDRYHSRWSCPALVSGQMLNDFDCVEYCTHDHRQVHPALDYGIPEMAESGRTPCRVCVPPLAPAEDFGHAQIMTIIDGRALNLACRRCSTVGPFGHPQPVRWPCASAVVLGLTPTT